jgi:polysaccharide export outer membrane protein
MCLSAQARPTPAQAQALLQTRPDLVEQLRQRFLTSGLTKDQIHARLAAAGYPEDMLDAYLPDATGTAAEPTDSVFKAVRALGIADSVDVATLQGANSGQFGPPAGRAARDTSAVMKPGSTAFLDDTLRMARTARDSARIIATATDSGFTIFGLDVFRSSTSQFEPSLAGPVDANYRLGPGDRLVLILTGDVEASYQLDVTREGFVVIPQVGRVDVANLTLGQLESVLSTRLSRVYSGVRPNNQGTTRYSVSVAKLRTNQIYVAGDVRRPGSYVISSTGTALTALYAAGGPTINGTLRRVEIRRFNRIVDTLDVYDYLVRGDASHDVRLETGDVVFVAIHGNRVRVVGEVARPATYELKTGETLADLVRDAGGFRATASQQRVLIERIVSPDQRSGQGNDRITVDVSSATMLARAGAGVQLQNGDVVRVYPIAQRIRNRVTVMGNVYQPGALGLTPGMMLSDVLRTTGLKPDTYLGEVLITRLQSDTTRIQLRAMLADTTGRVINDFPLREDDQISVYSLGTFRPDRFVAIGGAVKSGGHFPYHEGMTLRDLVLKEAEIARLPVSRDGGRTATTIRVPLDSTYLFDRKPNGDYAGPPGLPALPSGAPEVVLQPYDNVLILRQPNWELQRTVVLQGEVRFPGAYALVAKTEHLSDVIKRAGGLTDEAYAEGIVFLRQNVGRVGVDLPAALGNYESSDNLIMRDADNVTIPARNSIVIVRGAVNQPSALAYVPGMGISYYVQAAGGVSKNGDEDRAFVVQPSGKVESSHHHFFWPNSLPEPRAGSVVTVPELDPADKKDYIALTGTVAQIIASTVAIIVAVRSTKP